jgi:nitrous oxide reductase accessory protein NosL
MQRRRFLAMGLALTPIAAALSACGEKGDWPEGMAAIKWDRDTCVRCNMVISDRRFAAEMRGGPKQTVFKFDDVGCLVFWLRDKAQQFPWILEPATRMWVADAMSRPGESVRWLDPQQAHYLGGRTSPMGYNFAAIAQPQAGSIDFSTMRQQILALGK